MRERHLVLALGTAQTVAWASSFYLPAMLAAPQSAELGLDAATPFALLSMALVVAALTAPWAGRRIDRLGGRNMLLASNGLFAGGLALLATAQGLAGLVAGWLVLGLAMACGLYDAAFATLVRLLGSQARRAITGITLIAGFASTVGWPLTTLMAQTWGWRGACWGWVALHLLLALPLNRCLPRARPPAADGAVATGAQDSPAQPEASPPPAPLPRLLLVALLFTLMSLVSTAVATHLPALLIAIGVPLVAAVALAALAGPAQVAARLFEWGVLSRFSPLLSARLAVLGHPLGALAVLLAGPVAALPFVLLHGLGNGLLTIVRGTLPLALFGAQGYGARQGWIALPGRLLGALAPWGMGLLIQAWGGAALWFTAGCGVLSVILLLLLRLPPDAGPGHNPR
jgi:MFS family permease